MNAYIKKALGNKLFTIEWDLVVSGGVVSIGDQFEAIDCVPLSLHCKSDNGVFVKLDMGDIYGVNLGMQISGSFFLPATPDFLNANSTLSYTPKPVMPPPMRFYAPQASANPNDGSSKVALLFKEV